MFGSNNNSSNNAFFPVKDSPNETISAITFSPSNNLFAATSWNKEVRVYEYSGNGMSQGKAINTSHTGPVLCAAFSPDGSTLFTGGCDRAGRMWNLQANQSTQVAQVSLVELQEQLGRLKMLVWLQHDASIKAMSFIPEVNMLVTGGWDGYLRYWDVRAGRETLKVQMPERVYALDVAGEYVAVATANRHILVYSVRNPSSVLKVCALW